MSFTNTVVLQKYLGTGAQTSFAIPFYLLPSNPDWIKVYLVDNTSFAETLQTLTTHYTLSPDQTNPVNVVMITPPTASQSLLIKRELPLTQATAFVNTGTFQKEDYEKALDRVVMTLQQVNEKVGRAVLHSSSSGYVDKSYPLPVEDAALVWDSSGNIVNLLLSEISGGTYNGTAKTFSRTSVSADTTIAAADTFTFVNVNSAGGVRNITLPLSASVGAGRIFVIADEDGFAGTNAITITRAGSDTINGATTVTISSSSGAFLLISDGTDSWFGAYLSSILPLSKGGTGKSLTAAAGGVVYTDTDSMEITAAGTAGQYLKSNAAAAPAFASFTPPTVQKFTTGSGTYTTPTGVLYIQVEMVGGGGGGGGSGTASGSLGGTGGNTTFGTTLLEANGGVGGGVSGGGGGTGGSASLGTGPVGIAVAGSGGGAGNNQSTSNQTCAGGHGAPSALGGGAPGPVYTAAGIAAATNSGGGGSGGGSNNVIGSGSGGGGGSGGFVSAIITSPSATYAYAVGASGTAGTAGTSGLAGGAGAAGQIIVREFYH